MDIDVTLRIKNFVMACLKGESGKREEKKKSYMYIKAGLIISNTHYIMLLLADEPNSIEGFFRSCATGVGPGNKLFYAVTQRRGNSPASDFALIKCREDGTSTFSSPVQFLRQRNGWTFQRGGTSFDRNVCSLAKLPITRQRPPWVPFKSMMEPVHTSTTRGTTQRVFWSN